LQDSLHGKRSVNAPNRSGGKRKPADAFAWASANRFTTEPLFNLPISYRGGRCWVIDPADEDAAFALRMRWL